MLWSSSQFNPQLCFFSSPCQTPPGQQPPTHSVAFFRCHREYTRTRVVTPRTNINCGCLLPTSVAKGCRGSCKVAPGRALRVRVWKREKEPCSDITCHQFLSMKLILGLSFSDIPTDLNLASAFLSFVDKDLKASCPLYDPEFQISSSLVGMLRDVSWQAEGT